MKQRNEVLTARDKSLGNSAIPNWCALFTVQKFLSLFCKKPADKRELGLANEKKQCLGKGKGKG